MYFIFFIQFAKQNQRQLCFTSKIMNSYLLSYPKPEELFLNIVSTSSLKPYSKGNCHSIYTESFNTLYLHARYVLGPMSNFKEKKQEDKSHCPPCVNILIWKKWEKKLIRSQTRMPVMGKNILAKRTRGQYIILKFSLSDLPTSLAQPGFFPGRQTSDLCPKRSPGKRSKVGINVSFSSFL